MNASNALFFDVTHQEIDMHQTLLMYALTNDGPTEAFRTVNFTLAFTRFDFAYYHYELVILFNSIQL